MCLMKIFELLPSIVQRMVILFSPSKFHLQEDSQITRPLYEFVFSTSIIHTGVKALFLEGLWFRFF